ncbi:hypothetical protein A3A71_04145 [Candidatus Berkelbacteria bacterium RIFCSPLOWO2_01_FULL_50_28]|uniref:Uncharacterized protein n=1 Tax=Candidatus Berkelbacteria bacterium RIFCSPLOWO2_01_FULL_50_28 TaxID=1797471 RepID=A0A1F5EAP6_9BACT|nr:MAG: hypothetical protein A2807_03465 [Candidatus Berkelbacteria bacterium RIFCSPHIGHO2_01_FULL_50_36]OGD62457.1 MAG: hypothetical protein A3F39_02005 [Candidatus Berkelbacteria bacterium RIFCSPHIGHO2_12_FULL_50_11]OGD64324.1 MAG: hypothetical protein A3A71_04145 [Candidatus Berkelbacteria bacterium RIFCSPLOWO2_01_FULL_50_28]
MKVLIEKRLRALELRKKAMSYSQIKSMLGVSKSTLSLWLRDFPLSHERIQELRGSNEGRIEKFRDTMRQKKEKRLDEVLKRELKDLSPLTERELYVAGLFLYWGEGGKTNPFELSLGNTNPKIAKFFLHWAMHCLGLPKSKIKARLQLYVDMDIPKEMEYWIKTLDLPIENFHKPYIKATTLRGLTFKGYGHGTCDLRISHRDSSEKVLMAIKALSEKYSESLSWEA